MSSNSLPSINLSTLMSAMGSSMQGIDVSATVSQLITAERVPELQWQQQQQGLQQQANAISQVNGLASTLSDALANLRDPVGALAAMAVTSSQPGIVSATALPGVDAGTHMVVVNRLASTASWYSGSVSSGSAQLSPGSLNINVGSNTTTITVGDGINTLNDLASYINGLGLGVTASVVNDTTGARLGLVSQSSGSRGDFSVTNTAGMSFTQAAQGLDASLSVDGIPITSATNTVAGALNGITLNLLQASPGSQIALSVAPNAAQVTASITSFVSAYNSLIQQINAQFTYNASSQSAGILAGDSGLSLLQSVLLGAASYTSGGSSSAQTLRSLGISMNNDGTLSIDSSALNNAIQNNFGAVQTFFQGTAGKGFASFLNTQLNLITDPSDGAFTVELNSIRTQENDLQHQIDNFEVYIASEQTRLTNEYNLANIALQQLTVQQQQLQAELGNAGWGSTK